MIDAELEVVKIPKMGDGKSHNRYPHSKSQYPPPPPGGGGGGLGICDDLPLTIVRFRFGPASPPT